MNHIIHAVRQELQHLSDDNTRSAGQRFFKEPVRMYGVPAAAAKTISGATV